MNITDLKDLLSVPFVQSSIVALWNFALVVLATMTVTQIIKMIMRYVAGAKYGGLVVHLTAMLAAVIFARLVWIGFIAQLAGGFAAYMVSVLAAKYGLMYLKRKFKP